MQILKQSTATTVYVGPVLDSAGAAVTTAVLGDFRLVKNGTAATLSGATVTHDANGYYTIALTTGNTDTVGRLTIAVGNTAMSMATHRYTVLLASVFDAIVTNATNTAGGLLTATAAISGLSGVIATTTNITSATGIVLAAATHTGAVIPTVTTVTNRVSANTDQWGGVAVTGMPMPTYTQPTGFLAATFPGTVASTTNITTVGAVSGSVGSVASNGITAASLAADASSEIAAAVRTELATELGRIDVSLSSRSSHTASDVWQVATRTLTAFSFSVTVGTIASNAITAATLAADAGAEIAAAVRSELATELARIDAATSSRSSHSAADVWSVATRTLTAFSFSVTVGTNNDKTGYSLATAPLDASGTAAAVWGAALASYTSNTTFGGRILRTDQASSGNSAKVTSAGHVAADIHELQPAVIQSTHFAAGAIDASALAADAASEIASAVRTNLATELGRIDATTSSRASQTSVDTLTTYVDTEVAAIKAKTDNLPANPAAVSDIPTTTAIADMVLSRSVANVETTAGEHTLCTLVLAALEGVVSGNTWTIRRTNGSTTHYTKTVTSDANAAPIVSVQ